MDPRDLPDPPRRLPAPANIFNFTAPAKSRQRPKPDAHTRQIHRNRVSYSCHACRRRKVKCDRLQPVCGNCIKTAELCVYDGGSGGGSGVGRAAAADPEGGTKRRRTIDGADSGRPPASPPQKAPSLPQKTDADAGKQAELETRMNRLAEIVNRWYKDASASRETGVAAAAAAAAVGDNGFAQSHHYLELLQQSTGPQQSASPSPQQTSPRNSTTPGSSIVDGDISMEHMGSLSRQGQLAVGMLAGIDAARRDDDVGDLGIGHLSIQGGGRTRYVGTSFWGLLSSEINELNSVLKTHVFDQTPPPGECPGMHRCCPEDSGGGGGSGSGGGGGDGGGCPPPPPPPPPPHPHPSGDYTTEWPPPASVPPPARFPGGRALNIFSKVSLLEFEPRSDRTRFYEVVPRLMKMLPPRAHCDGLYRSFLDGVHPIMPLIHVPTFAAQYRCFWRWYPDNMQHCPAEELTDSPTFLPLMMAILYAGAISLSAKATAALTHGEHTQASLTSHLYGATMASLGACAFPRSPTVNSLTAFLMVQTCLIREEEPLTSCSFVGMAMRVAQSMGLHRDGSLFGLNDIECEVRRRVWWHILYLDVQGAIATGLPPLGGSGDDLYDTKMVSELKDEYIGLAAGAPEPVTSMSAHHSRCQEFYPQPLEKHTSPAMILAVGRYESTSLLRTILTRLFAIKGSRKSDLMEMGKMIYELKMKLEVRISRIPARGIPEMGFVPPPTTGACGETPPEVETAIVFNSWARIMLSLLSDRAFGVLYQPFLKSAKSTLWKHARNCALHFCHSFLRKFIHLSRTPLFQPYHWFCPGTYQPLHATMILLLDLHERPFMPEAAKSRGFIDQIFAVFGEHGNYNTGDGEGGSRPLMEGGREAWRMLWRLRTKAYEKAGIPVPLEPTDRDPTAAPPVATAAPSMCSPYAMQMATDDAATYPTTTPQSPQTAPTPMPTTPALPPGGFEQLLQMDTIIDAENKAFFTEQISADLARGGQLAAAANTAATAAAEEEEEEEEEEQATVTLPLPPPPPTLEALFAATEAMPEEEDEDLMDFNWEEWDQVFGKSVYVDDGLGI